MKNKANEFLNAISENKEIREYLEKYQLPEGAEKEDCLAAVAEKFGYTVTKEELAEAFRCKQEELKSAMAGAEEALKELDPEELAAASGGGGVGAANQNIKGKGDHPECKASFKDRENCWVTDGCDITLFDYANYLCKYADVG